MSKETPDAVETVTITKADYGMLMTLAGKVGELEARLNGMPKSGGPLRSAVGQIDPASQEYRAASTACIHEVSKKNASEIVREG